MRNNLQMKNNQFRSNAISGRAVGQTEARSCQSAPLLPKQRVRTAEHGGSGEGWRDHSEERRGEGSGGEGRGSGRGRSQDIRMMVRRGREGRWILCSDIAGLAPGELDINSPCQSAFNTQGHLTLRGEADVGQQTHRGEHVEIRSLSQASRRRKASPVGWRSNFTTENLSIYVFIYSFFLVFSL